MRAIGSEREGVYDYLNLKSIFKEIKQVEFSSCETNASANNSIPL